MERKTIRLVKNDKPKEILSSEAKRLDGRTPTQFRNIFLKCGLIKVARGSAYIELNKTKVICAVYGPKNITTEFVEKGRINCDVQMTSFANKESKEVTKQYSIYLKEALEASIILEKFPKSVVDIYCYVLQDDGSVLSSAITCASLALANAGIELYSLVSSCTACEVNGEIIIDPTHTEEKFSNGQIVACMMTPLKELSHLTQIGVMKYTKVVEAMDLCVDTCSKIQELMGSALKEPIKTKIQ